MGLFQSKNVLGLDIGSTYIKAAEMNVTKRGAKLLRFGYAPTPQGTLDRGEIVDAAGLSQVIKNVISEMGTKRKNACVGIWGTAVIVKKITLSGVEKQYIGDIIRDEAEQYIPFDINDINLGYFILENRSQSIESLDLLLIGAQKDFVFSYAESIEMSGLHCATMDVSGFALANCFQMNYGDLPGEVVGLLNFGGSVTNFTIVDNGDVVFSRDIPIGGMTYTTDIQKHLSISYEEAEGLKLSFSQGQPGPEELGGIIQTTTDAVVEELTRSLDFYNATAGEAPVQKFFITGGSSLVPNLQQSISTTLNANVQYLDPFSGIQFDGKNFSDDVIQQIAPFASIAMGLGLRKIGDS